MERRADGGGHDPVRGSLAENVDTYFNTHQSKLPPDIASTNTSKPVAVVYDETGVAINAIYGAGASSPQACANDGVITGVDNLTTGGTIAHALILVNGLCATTTAQLATIQYQLVRAFGRVLGLDWSQANEEMFSGGPMTNASLAGWPIMHPVEYLCNSGGGTCMPNETQLRTDDIAALNRLYPVTEANLGIWPGKTITALATISVQGTIAFATGQGMQGVNVVLQPLVNGAPSEAYTVTAVSGVYFLGNVGNAITGTTDTQGNALNRFGGSNETLEGFFDLSGIPLPPGKTTSDYQLTFEAINPMYTGTASTGPYTTGQVTPSGTMPVITLPGLSAGSVVTETVVIGDSADAGESGPDGVESSPANVPVNGEWTGQITGYGHTAWFQWWARGGREFTIEAEALDETGAATENKAQLVIGAWNGTDAVGTAPVTGTAQPFNGAAAGLTTLPVLTGADSEVRIGLADLRGDGRPDYGYRGRVLYADSVTPARVPVTGGQIVIQGMGFRPSVNVTVNGILAQVLSVTPNTIVALAPASGGATGTVPIQIQDCVTLGVTAINTGFSYDAGSNDALSIVTGPPSSAPMGVPEALTVRAMNVTSQTPAPGVVVTFQVTAGTAGLSCGQTSCSVVTAGDGAATLVVTANSPLLAQVTAALTNGSSVTAQFVGTAPPSIAALTPNLYIAMGATVQWPVQTLVLNAGGAAVAGQDVSWAAAGSGVSVAAGQSVSGTDGIAADVVTAGPLTDSVASSVTACLAGSMNCVSLNVIPVQPVTEALVGWSGTTQYVAAAQSFAPVVVHVVDAFGDPVTGETVNFAEAFYGWMEPCPADGNCPPAPLLSQQSVQTVSAFDGSVTLMPLQAKGLAGRLMVMAAAGTDATLNFELDAHP
ncbi:MAG: IPT/TIG domain-containing protein [Acidobacteriaceae bacterium]